MSFQPPSKKQTKSWKKMFQNKEEVKEVENHLAEEAEDQEEMMRLLLKQHNHNNDIIQHIVQYIYQSRLLFPLIYYFGSEGRPLNIFYIFLSISEYIFYIATIKIIKTPPTIPIVTIKFK